MTWRHAPVPLLAILLASCSSTAPRTVPVIEPTRVEVPVPVPCLTHVPDAPVMASGADLAALPDDALILTLHRDRLALRSYTSTLQALLAACVSSSID